MKNQRIQIANPKLNFIKNCSNKEKKILRRYWLLENNEFTNTPKDIRESFGFKQAELNKITSTKASFTFYIFCKNCNSYEKHEVKSQTAFKNFLSVVRSRYKNHFKCCHCNKIQEERRKKEQKKKYEILVAKLETAVKNKNWEKLSAFELGILKNRLEMNFDDLKKHYFNLLGRSQYFKFIKAIENIAIHDLLIIDRNPGNNRITNCRYIQSLYDVKGEIEINKRVFHSQDLSDVSANELKLKLTIDKKRYHPDSPLYSGTIVFKEEITIKANVEYVFAQWERANDNLYFTLIPMSKFEKRPTQKPISHLPITLQKGISDFFKKIRFN